MLKRADTILRVSRAICHHNFRPSIRSTSSPGNICVLCICEKIDEFFESESDHVPSLSNISDIMHNVRLINTSLDSYDRMDGTLSEITIRPIIDTVTGLLKLANDEIGLMIAQGVQKLCPKISSGLREHLMMRIVSQILGSPILTIGVIECLRVVLQTEECLVLFLEKFGQEVLPIALKALRVPTVEGRRRRNNIQHTQNSQSQQLEINGQSLSQTNNESEGENVPIRKDDKHRIIIAIYSIMERTFEIPSKENSCSLDMFQSNGTEVFQAYLPLMADIIADCVMQLREGQPMSILGKVLGFLTKVFQHETSLSILLKSGHGYPLFSALKRMFFSHFPIVQKISLNVLFEIFTTFQTAMEVPGQHQTHIVGLPALIQQVDLIHVLSQTLSTSDSEVFRVFLQLLNILHSIPYFKGKLLILVEDGLRIASLSMASEGINLDRVHQFFLNVLNETEIIPFAIQKQITSLYGNLRSNIRTIDKLNWAKLLLFCTDSSFKSVLMEYYENSLTLLKNNPCSVSCLKLLLTLSHALMNCSQICSASGLDSNSNCEENACYDASSLLMSLMQVKCLPSVMVLGKCGKATESVYIRILLLMLYNFPLELLKPSKKYSNESNTPNLYTVEYEIEDGDSSSAITSSQEVYLYEKNLLDENKSWSAGACMKILIWIRQNMELLKDKVVFDLWNENIGRIIGERYALYFPGIANLWPHLIPDGDDNIRYLTTVFEKLDLDLEKWNKFICSNSFENSEDLKLQNEGVLIFYYFFFLFTMEDDEQVFSPVFLGNLGLLLENLLENKDYLQNENKDNGVKSAYFKASFLIASCQSHSIEPNSRILEAFDTAVLDMEDAFYNSQEILTFCAKVFRTLIEWKLLPAREVSKIMDAWRQEDKKEFEHFFWTVDFINNSYSEEMNSTLKNHILEVAAFGSEEASNFMLKLMKNKRLENVVNFEPQQIHEILTKLKNNISSEMEQEKLSPYLPNFANVLDLAIGDDPLFCHDLMFIPSEFYDDIIILMIKYHSQYEIGVTCLNFLWKYLSNSSNLVVQRICLLNHDFVHFLGKRLQGVYSQSHYEERYLAFELMTLVINALDIPEDYEIFWRKGSKKVCWSISSLLPNIQFYRGNLSFLKFLSTLLSNNLNCEVVDVEENNSVLVGGSLEAWKVLLTVNFHVQNLFHKLMMEEDEAIIWNFFIELLFFSQRANPLKILFASKLYADPWSLFMIETAILKTPSPYSLDKECLKYLMEWMKIVVSEEKRKVPNHFFLLSLPNTCYQVYSFSGVFHKLATFLNPRQTETSIDSSLTEWDFGTNMDLSNNEDENKTPLIKKLALYCSKILEKHSKENFFCSNFETEDSSLSEDDPDSEDQNNNENSSSMLIEEIHEMLQSPSSLNSSTCSESELDEILSNNNNW